VPPNELMVGEPQSASQASSLPEVLHYLGYDEDHGGIVAVIRALAATGRFRCRIGMNRGCVQRHSPALPVHEFSALEAERLGAIMLFRTWRVAREARRWLHADSRRLFHGHSRAGLLVALWLHIIGERRVMASVHTLGQHRWLYRAAGRVLGARLFWLSPAMKRHYGVGPANWSQCLPDCVPEQKIAVHRIRSDGNLTLGAVGPFAACKRWDILIDALGLLSPAARSRVRVIQAGAVEENPATVAYAAELRRRADAQGTAPMIEWRGRVAPLTAWWTGIDCLIVASPIEAFGIAALEALVAGVPVLASSSAGTSDLVRECRGGWLFAGDSSQSLAARINELLDTDALAAWQLDVDALRGFFAPVVADRWLAAYEGLLNFPARSMPETS
jgi:glycosyltransferase involved in cell wall biosynthesis